MYTIVCQCSDRIDCIAVLMGTRYTVSRGSSILTSGAMFIPAPTPTPTAGPTVRFEVSMKRSEPRVCIVCLHGRWNQLGSRPQDQQCRPRRVQQPAQQHIRRIRRPTLGRSHRRQRTRPQSQPRHRLDLRLHSPRTHQPMTAHLRRHERQRPHQHRHRHPHRQRVPLRHQRLHQQGRRHRLRHILRQQDIPLWQRRTKLHPLTNISWKWTKSLITIGYWHGYVTFMAAMSLANSSLLCSSTVRTAAVGKSLTSNLWSPFRAPVLTALLYRRQCRLRHCQAQTFMQV